MSIELIFTDIGGVLLTNGWDREARKRAIQHFSLDYDEFEERHRQVVDDLERGILTLESYMRHVVFSSPRFFGVHDFQEFMFSCSQPYHDMLMLLPELKKKAGCKIAALSNEGKELACYRIQKFLLKDFIDYFIVSSFIGTAKPDERIFTLALDVSACRPANILYIDDRAEHIEVGKRMGFHTILHRNCAETQAAAEMLFLKSSVVFR